MDRYVIRGGNSLSGRIRVSGSKNSILPMMAASLLSPERCRIIDAPVLRDVNVMVNILRKLGAEVSWTKGNGLNCLEVCAGELITHEVPEDLMREMRSSIFLMGPILGRMGKVTISYPGGCAIGPRPIDYHLRGLQQMGADITERHGFIHAVCEQLQGAEIHLDFPSVGTTENLMMAGVFANGETVIRNAAKEPEIVDLQTFINSLGAEVRGAGTDTIRVLGNGDLTGADHVVIPDRIEAGTFVAAVAAAGGDVVLENIISTHLDAPLAKIREAGVTVIETGDALHIKSEGRVCAVDCKTLPYPGFPTDLQPQMMSLMTTSVGTAIVSETVFESRFSHVEELRRMGASIKLEGRTAIIKGVEALSGAVVRTRDLRSGAALVIAGLVGDGTTMVECVHHIDRGYERLSEKLQSVGADIIRLKQAQASEAVGE